MNSKKLLELSEYLQKASDLLKELSEEARQEEMEKEFIPRCEFLDMERTAKFLNVSRNSLYRMTHQKVLPYYKAGGRIYFKYSEVIDWMEKNRVESDEEMQSRIAAMLIKRGNLKV